MEPDVSTYRPIAVLPAFGKLFEAIMESRISQQISNLLDDRQHGFRKSRSTNTNLINLVDYAATEMDSGHQVDIAYFDFRKAFDMVDNDILLNKLAILGFAPKLVQFFASYLRDRSQFVKIAGHESQTYYTRSGVSQGSTLGPLQFLIMINDLPKVVSTAKCLMFADDVKLFSRVDSEADALALQRDVNRIAEWSAANRLPLNESKCKILTLTRSRSPICASYNLPGVTLERVHRIRDLGVIVDAKLDFREHITETCKSSCKTLGFIMRIASQFSDPKVAKTLYNAYVRSRLEFGAIIWDTYEAKYSLMVERIQRKYARWLYKRLYGYYPFLYPSLFVAGMVGVDTLLFRRRQLLLEHYYSVLNGKVDNPCVLEKLGLIAGGVCVRRQPPLFARCPTRTCRADQAPTQRALALLGSMLARSGIDADVFRDSKMTFTNKIKMYLNVM